MDTGEDGDGVRCCAGRSRATGMLICPNVSREEPSVAPRNQGGSRTVDGKEDGGDASQRKAVGTGPELKGATDEVADEPRDAIPMISGS